MLICFAPMEGITVYPFRMTHQRLYGGVDRYFLPFVEAHQTMTLKTKEKKDLLPGHNPGGRSVPQLMSNHADLALAYIRMLAEYGYQEVNFNLGCPSGTVTAKKKGAGFLADPDAMDRFFDQLFRGMEHFPGIRISVKTRIGMYDASCMDDLIRVYSRYPFCEVIVHPRLGKDAYRGSVDLEAFSRFYEEVRNPVSYNGDLRTVSDAKRIISAYPRLHAIMIGRGLLADPALAEKIRRAGIPDKAEDGVDIAAGSAGIPRHARVPVDAGGSDQPAPLDDPRLPSFLSGLERAWMDDLGDATSVLYRLKEYWSYLSWNFEDSRKVQKKIMKTRSLDEYHAAVSGLLH